jgi:3'-phosphoadenosine 5'-phosphosulfate sulfotransferase (PAPS reductase)/FAD synthetase
MVPLVVSFGGGVNSAAMLVGMKERGITPSLIIFADTGGEKPETYSFVSQMSEWTIENQGKLFPETVQAPCVCFDGEEDD